MELSEAKEILKDLSRSIGSNDEFLKEHEPENYKLNQAIYTVLKALDINEYMEELGKEKVQEIDQARKNILRGVDLESSAIILNAAIFENVVFLGGRVNPIKIATRQILDFLSEFKTKDYWTVLREKVKRGNKIQELNQQIQEQQRVINELKEEKAILKQRLWHLFRSEIIKKYDLKDWRTGKYKLNIDEFDERYGEK